MPILVMCRCLPFGFSRYLDGPSVSKPLESYLLWFPLPSPIITEFTISSCCCQCFLAPCYSRTSHIISTYQFHDLNSLGIGKSHFIIVSTYVKEAVMLIKSRMTAPRENPTLIGSKTFSLFGSTPGPGWVSLICCWAAPASLPLGSCWKSL